MRDRAPRLEYVRRMRQNAALNAAFAALDNDDEYTRAFRVAEQADQRLRTLQPAPDYGRAVADIIDRGELPDDFTGWLHRHNDSAALHEAEKTALIQLRDQALGRVWYLSNAHVPELLASLHQQLLDLVDEARPAAETLAGLEDAESILRAGAEPARAFSELDEHWNRYVQIRAGQNKVIHEWIDDVLIQNAQSPRCPDPAANDFQFANVGEMFPEWRQRTGESQSLELGATGMPLTPKPPAPWPDRGPLQLAWFINHGAEFWVPTPQQVEALQKERQQRAYQLRLEEDAPPHIRERMRAEREALRSKSEKLTVAEQRMRAPSGLPIPKA